MKWKNFFKDFFTSKKLVMKDVLLYAFWAALGIILISKIWTIADPYYSSHWGFEGYVSYFFHIIYDIFMVRIVFEVLTALFDIRESLIKK